MKEERPEEATIEGHGVRMTKTIVHANSEEYNGADIYMEGEGQKFALVQFKIQPSYSFNFERNNNYLSPIAAH